MWLYSLPTTCIKETPLPTLYCWLLTYVCQSVSQFSRSVVSDSLWPHESQHARPPCPSPTPGVYSHSCPSSRWCHPAISSSVAPFSSCPQSLPASGTFPVSQLFTGGGQTIGVSASASVCIYVCMYVLVAQSCLTVTPWTVSSMLFCPWGFPDKNTSGLPFHSSGDLPNPGIEPRSLTWREDALPFGLPINHMCLVLFLVCFATLIFVCVLYQYCFD